MDAYYSVKVKVGDHDPSSRHRKYNKRLIIKQYAQQNKFGDFVKIPYIGFTMGLFNIHIHHHYINEKLILKQLKYIMATLQELSDKVDVLQVALDAEQEQIAAAVAALQQTVADLNVLVAEGGSPQERQAIIDKINATIADLESTIA